MSDRDHLPFNFVVPNLASYFWHGISSETGYRIGGVDSEL